MFLLCSKSIGFSQGFVQGLVGETVLADSRPVTNKEDMAFEATIAFSE
jgi:hypothetical protein